jgi:hypothetical protein
MVTVKVKTVKDTIEVFNTESYVIGKKKDLHPDLLTVDVYAGSRKVYHMRRYFQWFYKKFLYKPERVELKQVDTEVEHQKG